MVQLRSQNRFWQAVYLNRNYVAALHDALMAALSFPLALYLRLGTRFSIHKAYFWEGLLLFTLVCVTVFWAMRLYRGLWRYASLQDLATIAKAVTLAQLAFFVLLFLFTRLEGVPRSVLFINWGLLILLLGGPRFLYRIIKDRALGLDLWQWDDKRIPVLLVGGGNNAELFLRDAGRKGTSLYRAVGIVDDDRTKHGRQMRGVRILGNLSVTGRVLDKLARKGAKPQKMIITSDAIPGSMVRHLLEVGESKGVGLSRLPNLTDFRASLDKQVRPVAIEDLLGRPQNPLDYDAMRRFIAGKVVLVTGAGGTIGGELTRQVAGFDPAQLILLDHAEHNLYRIDMEMTTNFPGLKRRSIIADVRDATHLRDVFMHYQPEIVFHAAALKHVPLSELNPEEAVLTNAMGTRNVAELCESFGIATMVMISTDKAVNPANVMGATKRLAESYCQALGQEAKAGNGTRFITVRFGNVLGSSGSVIPLFQEQLMRGGPLTITHPEITRYFMTLREAVGLVIMAATLGVHEAESRSRIYVLDMGQPVRIRDMAEQMIKLAGLKPGVDVQLEYTGLRPGEKLYEELFYFAEAPAHTGVEGIMLASPRPVDGKALLKALKVLEAAARARDVEDTLRLLRQLVPEYTPVDDKHSTL